MLTERFLDVPATFEVLEIAIVMFLASIYMATWLSRNIS